MDHPYDADEFEGDDDPIWDDVAHQIATRGYVTAQGVA